MRPTLTSLAVALMFSLASVCYAQPATTNQTRDTPDFTVHVWGYIVADFSARVWDYSELRSELEKGPSRPTFWPRYQSFRTISSIGS